MKPHTRLLKWSLATACLLILAGVRVSAQVNLLPQGNFESPGVNSGWAEGFNIPNNQEFQVISEHGKHWLRIENRDAGRQLDYVHSYVKVSPEIASLTISVRMRASNLKIGKAGWHTARVALMFEGGSFGYPPEVPELRADSDWVTKSVEWQGRVISLHFERVSTDAMVYVNGTQCGNVSWPWGSVDITRAVAPGETAEIQVLVAAIADPEKVGSFWQNALSNVSYRSARLETQGLTGRVFLESRTSAERVTDVFVRTSTRKKEVSLDVELTGVKQTGQVQFVAEMLDDKGAVEKTFTAEAAVDAEQTTLHYSVATNWAVTVHFSLRSVRPEARS